MESRDIDGHGCRGVYHREICTKTAPGARLCENADMKCRFFAFLILVLGTSLPCRAVEALDLLKIGFPEARQDRSSGFDSTVSRENLPIRRVAIIPNRLPLMISGAETWRR